MAEGALRARIAASPLAGRVEVDSAGTGDWHIGQPPHRLSIATAARHGVDITGLRARQITPADADAFDWLLCADRGNLRDVRALIPPARHPRADLLLGWSGIADAEVPDPYTADEAEFERIWQLLDHAAAGVVTRLLAEGAGRHGR